MNGKAHKIVVGIDGSKEALAAVHWAVEEAARRGATVEIIYAWHYVYLGDPMGISAVGTSPEIETSAQLLIDEALAEIATTAGTVQVTGRTVEGVATKVLLDAAATADLIVVGRRGHGGFMGLLLGSVAQQLAHHAPCPLVIVPTTPES